MTSIKTPIHLTYLTALGAITLFIALILGGIAIGTNPDPDVAFGLNTASGFFFQIGIVASVGAAVLAGVLVIIRQVGK